MAKSTPARAFVPLHLLLTHTLLLNLPSKNGQYFDVPGAMDADKRSRAGPEFRNIPGGSSVGGAFRSSGKAAGKRMRVRVRIEQCLMIFARNGG